MSTVMSSPDLHQFGEPQWHADGVLLALGYAADGSLWSVEEPGVLRQWDRAGRLKTRQPLGDIETLWAFSRRAELLASGTNELVVWEVAGQRQLAALRQTSWVTAMAFHPTRRAIATGHDDGTIRFWELTGADRSSFVIRNSPEPVSALAFNADGSVLASASEDRKIAVWDLPAGKLRRTMNGHTDRIPALAWQPGTDLLVSAGWDTTVRLWDLRTGEPSMLLNTHSDQVYTLAFSPDGKLLAVADSSGSVHVWSEIARGKELHVLPGDLEEIHSLAFSPDGRLLAVGGNDWVIHIWDPRAGKLVAGQAVQSGHSIDLSPGSPPLLLSNGGGTLHVWRTPAVKAGVRRTTPGSAADLRQEALPSGQVDNPLAVACSPDGRWIAVTNAEPESRLHFWDNKTQQLRPPVEGPRAGMTFAAFSPDSKALATCCRTDGTAWLWNPADGEPLLIIPEAAEGCTVEAVAFHPNSKLLACGGVDHLQTSGSDGAVTIWSVQDRQRSATLVGGALSLAFHPAGRRLAVASPASIVYIWDVESQEVVQEFSLADADVAAVAFSPDGRYLAVGCDDRTLRLWDADDERWVQVELDTPIRAVHFSPDGQTLYTGNGNTTCYAVPVARLLDS
jgi:WD40 repeat protein